MRKLKTLLVLSGLAISVLAGCDTHTKPSSSPAPSTTSNPVSEPTSAPTSEPTSVPSTTTSSQVVKTLESIRIAAEPTKKNYFVGDAFEPAGLQVKAVYNTGEEDLASGYDLSGFDSTTAGEKTITVTYLAKTATFKVNVEAVVLTGIEIAAEPTKKTYYAGDAFDAAGLQVKAVFNNGKKEDLAADAYALSGFDTNVAGAQTITVTYQEKTATFAVTVIGKDGIAVTAPKKVRYAVGEEFDATGLVVAQRFADGTQVPLAADAYTLSGFDSETVGEKTVTVTYGNDTATFTVNVYKADWTDTEKALWTSEDPDADTDLLFGIPYFLSFEFSKGGIANEQDATQMDVEWYEARSAFKVKNSEFESYADAIEDILIPALDDDDNPIVDADGNPEYKAAWSIYQTTNGKDFSDDVDKLGFDEDSDIYQYARWSNDNTNYFAYQVLTIGVDEDGKLLAVTTVCNFPLFGWGRFGNPLLVNQKSGSVIDGLYALAAAYGAYVQFTGAPQPSGEPYFDHGIEYPEIAANDADAYCYYFNDAIDEPYLLANVYSVNYNVADFSLVFGTGKVDANNEELPFVKSDMDAVLAKYEGREGTTVTHETINGIDVATVKFNDAGFEFSIEYYLINGYFRMDVDIVDYQKPVVPTPADATTESILRDILNPLLGESTVTQYWDQLHQDLDGGVLYGYCGFGAGTAAQFERAMQIVENYMPTYINPVTEAELIDYQGGEGLFKKFMTSDGKFAVEVVINLYQSKLYADYYVYAVEAE